MATTDTSEKGLETLIVDGLCANGWIQGKASHFVPEFGLDLEQLRSFFRETQPALEVAFDLSNDSPTRRKFLERLKTEITKRGVIDVLRNGVKHGAHNATLMFGTPSAGNSQARGLYEANRFTVVRQLHFSPTDVELSVDVCLMINGLPVVTMELKNNLTRQNVDDAVKQYQTTRDPRELLFKFKRAVAHFAVDDQRIKFCTKLEGPSSWFLPFDKGFDDGAGNPPNPNGLKTSYLWEEVLTRDSLTNIIENYAQVIIEEKKDRKTGKVRKDEVQIWPRYHQLDAVRRLLADTESEGVGKKYLIQHSAGSGKSNSIAWLVHQLIRVEHGSASSTKPLFDSVIVITNRRVLDRQITETIRHFAQVGATVGHADSSKDLRELIVSGKKIIITTLQKFPFVVDEISTANVDRSFAVVIDEAHDSQSGRTATALSRTLQAKTPITEPEGEGSGLGIDDEDDADDDVQDLINAAMAGRKMATNASYFAFTATPKNKTEEMFGEAFQEDGKTKHRPFHSYTMKQAIQEGFIVDVLKHYTTIDSYYKLVKTIEGDPQFDSNRAKKKLRAYVEGHEHAIKIKSEIIVEHFLNEVVAPRRIDGKARVMVVCGSIRRAIDYFTAISAELEARNSLYKAIVAFSGEHDYAGKRVSEASLNGFPAKEIEDRIADDPYRILICADKFQTGYDQPLLHTMYVDKVLSGVKAVQTLSRLNRAHKHKSSVMVLDFQNKVDDIEEAFSKFYRTTVLSDQTDPNRLHDLLADLQSSGVYSPDDVDAFVEKFLSGADRDELDPLLDRCTANYTSQLDEDEQVKFKSGAKSFVRAYDFLGAILPYSNPEWETNSILLNFLVLKLPTPEGEDLSEGILEAIDMDSYRAEKQAEARIVLPDADGEIDPIPPGGSGGATDPEMTALSQLVAEFNDLFGNIDWSDEDRVLEIIATRLPERVNADVAYQNAKKNSDRQNARIEHDRALSDAITELLGDSTELFKQFAQNDEFKRWLGNKIFEETFNAA